MSGEDPGVSSEDPAGPLGAARCNGFAWAGVVALLVGVVGDGAICYLNFQFYLDASQLPHGTYVRPMGLAGVLIVTALGTMILGIPPAICAAIWGKPRKMKLVACLALLLVVIPMPLMLFLFGTAMSMAGVLPSP